MLKGNISKRQLPKKDFSKGDRDAGGAYVKAYAEYGSVRVLINLPIVSCFGGGDDSHTPTTGTPQGCFRVTKVIDDSMAVR